MKTIKLLDCTLRDGGFINNWEFELPTIRDIIYRLDKAGIDIIEVGFLNDSVEYNCDKTMVPNTKCLNKFFQNIKLENSMTVAMIDYGTCKIENIDRCEETPIDGIRVIFKKKDIVQALNYCEQIKNKGYKVFVQPVSITTYSDEEMLNLIKKVNELKPYAMSIVDTYGLLFKQDLVRYFYLIDNNLDENITVGYHSHNNYQLAYANSMELLEIKTDRSLMIDGSLFGMGKGAGNANTELLALHLNNNYGRSFDMDQILESIDIHISKIYGENKWGYSLPYYISASNDCHPSYVKFLMDKKTLSIKSINEILANIQQPDKLTFNNNLIGDLYFTYQQNNIDDSSYCDELSDKLSGNNILILAPGSSIKNYEKDINDYIVKKNPIILSVNFSPQDYDVDYIFVSNSKRYGQLLVNEGPLRDKCNIIATSNITESLLGINYRINYRSLINMYEKIYDNSTLMLMFLLKKLGVKNIALAGFDGFNPDSNDNYLNGYYNFGNIVTDSTEKNRLISKVLADLKGDLEIKFITPTNYQIREVYYEEV